jgi:hypothetical protein
MAHLVPLRTPAASSRSIVARRFIGSLGINVDVRELKAHSVARTPAEILEAAVVLGRDYALWP